METTASASSKAILFGEHAVVYGYPSVAVPLPEIRANAKIKDIKRKKVIIDMPDFGKTGVFKELAWEHPIRFAVDLFLSGHKITLQNGLCLSLHSEIPIASGMGSGAAISTAVFKALFAHFNIPYTAKKLSELVFEVEKLHHGTPSGIDNTVIAYEQAVLFRKDEEIQRINFPKTIHLVIANSGFTTPTKTTVSDVAWLYENNSTSVTDTFAQIEQCVILGLEALLLGDLEKAGEMMTENHQLLRSLTVSNERLDQLVDAANSFGAYGAKLSGGGRGGIVIALTEAEHVPFLKHTLLNAGAEACYSTKIGSE